jgi:hypothetical protein
VKRPETTLTGVSWYGGENEGVYGDDDHRFTVNRADHWVFAGTGLQNSERFGGYVNETDHTSRSVVGPESDRFQSDGLNGLSSPEGYTLASIYSIISKDFEVGTMGVFSSGNGGETFNAATINWPQGLNRDDGGGMLIDQITMNVISRLGPPRPSPWTSVAEGANHPGRADHGVTCRAEPRHPRFSKSTRVSLLRLWQRAGWLGTMVKRVGREHHTRCSAHCRPRAC